MERSRILELFRMAASRECLTEVLNEERQKGQELGREELLQILTERTHREIVVPGSTFDLVQQKVAMECKIERDLRKAHKEGLSWREACQRLNLGPGEDYGMWKKKYSRWGSNP